MITRVVHLINGLGKGGAETMLYNILKYHSDNAPKYTVISLGLSHYYEELIEELGFDLIVLDIRRNPIKSIMQIRDVLDESDILCCWMYISNLIGYLVGKRKVYKLIWCIRHSDLSLKLNSKKTLIINRICAHLSSGVDVIAYNGNNAEAVHKKAGYSPKREKVVDNGLDLTKYHKCLCMGSVLRKELGIGSDFKIILSVTKNHPIKDIPTFIKAFSLIKCVRDDVKAVMCGSGPVDDDGIIRRLCLEYNILIGIDIFLLGFRDDVEILMNGADVFVLHSAGEAFPNTLIQAMACGVPIVTTNVGDAKTIVGDSEFVVDPGDYVDMSKKINKLLNMDCEEINQMTRIAMKRVEEKYDIRRIVSIYEELYEE